MGGTGVGRKGARGNLQTYIPIYVHNFNDI